MANPVVIVTEALAGEPLAWLRERAEVIKAAPGDAEFEANISKADAMVVRTYTVVNRDLLAKAERLRVIGRAGVALDNFDLPACQEKGLMVVHAVGSNASAVAEYVFALIYDATRVRKEIDHAVALEEWERIRFGLMTPRQLEELTLGIYGLGRIGKRVARIAGALNMRVIYNDLLEMPEEVRHGATPVDVDTLLAQSDVLTVHVDDRPANRNLLDAAKFGRCKPGVLFLSCARGLIVDAAALADFLKANAGARAVCDVHEPEPFGPDYPLLGVPNARLMPHIAAATELAKTNMSWVVRDVMRVLDGEKPECPAPGFG
ncbi:MAG: 3-phosphoglycerate dehydrogenase [Phycisphaeraceae bacterium]|nr:MAG: 3-phosphoglycerate dehydrogenase [Phycisphaeraceae bacterium]